VLGLLIGGGFDTTTALTAHALEWLYENPADRERLSRDRDVLLDSATEEFLRFYTPAPGDGRTFSQDCEIDGVQFKEGERLWLSWSMANRDPQVFPDPNEIRLDRKNNRHSSFGLGIHRCIGSNVLPATFMPGPRVGPGLDETLETLQKACDDQRLADPITVR
jgi:cytochrome P450